MNLTENSSEELKAAHTKNNKVADESEHSINTKDIQKNKDHELSKYQVHEINPISKQRKKNEIKTEKLREHDQKCSFHVSSTEETVGSGTLNQQTQIGDALKISKHHLPPQNITHPIKSVEPPKIGDLYVPCTDNPVRLNTTQSPIAFIKPGKSGTSIRTQTLNENEETNFPMATEPEEENIRRKVQKLPSMGPLNITNLDEFLAKSKDDFEHLYNDKSNCKLNIKDFDLIKILGTGAFGRVVLGELKHDNTFYAIKIIDKKGVVERQHIRYVSNEKRILQGLNFPFVICLKYFFTDFYFLYYVMPYVPGGDFSRYLHKYKSLSESKAKFYVGQLVLALEYLHYLELIHRDLKPHNIMLDSFGYIKLADFGQCVRCYGTDKTWTYTGTVEYMAPEIIERKGYDCAVDWWALGVITFEMCAGQRPFTHKEPYKLHLFILSNNYTAPKHFSPSLKKLIKSIFVKDPRKRIANYFKRASQIKSHDWFKEVNWLALLNRTLKPPYLPEN